MRITGPLIDDDNLYAGQDPKTFEVLDSAQVTFIDGLVAFGTGSTFGRYSPCGYGNLTGKPTPDGRFRPLEIGQSFDEVIALVGYPDAKHAGLAKNRGLSLNPVDIRKDYRLEMSYAGSGRLLFAYVDPDYRPVVPGTLGPLPRAACPGLRLKWIIYNRREPSTPLERDNKHLRAYDGPPPESQTASIAPGMDEFGKVVDACRLVRPTVGASFDGTTGKAAPDSRFNLLRIGMTRDKVNDILGPETGSSPCGRAAYRGLGELEFSATERGQPRLSWIIHNAAER